MSLLNIVAFISFATSLFTRTVDPIVPQLATALFVAPATAALLASAFALPYAAAQPVLGALADMFSKTKLMTVCLVILVVASIVAAVATRFEVMVAARVVSGIAAGGVFPIALAIAGDRVAIEHRQVAISRLLAAAMLGNLLGASGAGIISDLFGWRAVFATTAFVGCAALASALHGFRKIEDAAPGRFDLRTTVQNYRTIFSNPQAKFCFGAVLIEAMFVFGLFPHVANLLRAGGEESASIAGIVLAGFGIGAVIYTATVSRVMQWFTSRQLMQLGGTAMALCLAAVAIRLPWLYEFAIFLLLGFGMYFLHGVIQVVASELAPGARGSAMALHSAAFFFGQAIGPLFYGQGFLQIGVTPTLMIAAVIVALNGFVAAATLSKPDEKSA